jgi:hypothetical protein
VVDHPTPMRVAQPPILAFGASTASLGLLVEWRGSGPSLRGIRLSEVYGSPNPLCPIPAQLALCRDLQEGGTFSFGLRIE